MHVFRGSILIARTKYWKFYIKSEKRKYYHEFFIQFNSEFFKFSESIKMNHFAIGLIS